MSVRHWQWEYLVCHRDGASNIHSLNRWLNRMGEQGWELVAIDGSFIFKRAKLA